MGRAFSLGESDLTSAFGENFGSPPQARATWQAKSESVDCLGCKSEKCLSRILLTETRLRTVGSAQNLLSLQYFYCASPATSCANNNGNIRSQSIGYDAVGGETAPFAVSQSYGYDKLNRLTTFAEEQHRKQIITIPGATVGQRRMGCWWII